MSRAAKLRALSQDPGATDGERQAAAAALGRHEQANPAPPPPERHSREWFAEIGKFQRRVSNLHVQIAALMPLGRPPLTWDEYKFLKNVDHSGPTPFNGPDVQFIEMCERKLAERSARQAEPIPLAYEPGTTVEISK
ncbi:hypothetical protein NKH85_16295 [Mesorhizobium sp. M0924]|uniref:hypothetical protein n=1 Tax=unclassified Mesorhizobium TaxID=325217 RepID=UPI0033395F65